MTDQSTTERIAELKKLAEAVTQWSNCNQAWMDSSEDTPAATVGHINEDGETYPVAVVDCDQYYAAQDSIKLARFYAAANPQAILSLIGHIAELEKALQDASEKLDEAADEIADWGAYASEYFQNKHDLKGSVSVTRKHAARFEAIAKAASHHKEDKA